MKTFRKAATATAEELVFNTLERFCLVIAPNGSHSSFSDGVLDFNYRTMPEATEAHCVCKRVRLRTGAKLR